jgi:mRNA-degrading endonuclease RelE of RelBE toxin-antitoxin system
MNIHLAASFKKDYQQLPTGVQQLFDRKLSIFIQNIRHPSLRIKKMKGFENRWEGSINMFYRFTFEIHDDYVLLRRIGPHDVLKNP